MNFKDSGIEWVGQIPFDWDVKKIKWLSSIKRGASPRPIDDPKFFDVEGEYAWVRIADVSNAGMFLEQTKQRMSELGASLSVKREPGDIFVSIAGTVGKPCITNIKCCIHDGFVYFPDYKGDKKYLYYIFESGAPYKGLGKMGTQLNLNTETIGSIKIPDIPVSLQKKIGLYLDSKVSGINHLLHLKQKQIDFLEQQRQSIITEAVTKGLNPNVKMKDSGVEWIGEIPAHWSVRKIKEIANVHSSNVDKKSIEGEKEVLLCNYVDVYYNDSINADLDFMKATAKDEQIETFTLKKHDVIITKDSESSTDIAIPTWVSQELEGVVCGYHLSLIRCFENTLGHYLYYTLESVQIREQFYTRANGVTRYGLSKEAIKNGLIAVPPYNEQIQIAEKLYAVNKEIRNMTEKIKKQISKLKEYRQSLIYEAVTGKIDVREMELH